MINGLEMVKELEDRNSFKELYSGTLKKYPILCVDDFYKNPDAVRWFALANEFHQNDGRWPGKRTLGIKELDEGFYNKFCDKLFALLFNMDKTIHCSIDTMFQLVEPLDQDPKSPKNTGWIHHDDNYLFAGIIYLSPNSDLENGTSIFRVANPDTIYHAESKVSLYRDGIDNGEHDRDLIRHNSSFQETIRFNNVYNRFISFPAEAYHGVNSFYNTSNEPRLTQVFFVKHLVTPYSPPVQRSIEQNDI